MNWKAAAVVAGCLCLAGNAVATGYILIQLRKPKADNAAIQIKALSRQVEDLTKRINGHSLSLGVINLRLSDAEKSTSAANAKADKANRSALSASANADYTQAEAYRARAKALEPCVIHGIC